MVIRSCGCDVCLYCANGQLNEDLVDPSAERVGSDLVCKKVTTVQRNTWFNQRITHLAHHVHRDSFPAVLREEYFKGRFVSLDDALYDNDENEEEILPNSSSSQNALTTQSATEALREMREQNGSLGSIHKGTVDLPETTPLIQHSRAALAISASVVEKVPVKTQTKAWYSDLLDFFKNLICCLCCCCFCCGGCYPVAEDDE